MAGSRTYNNYPEFSRYMREYLCRIGVDESSDIIFITGRARKGPDNMIMDFCREYGYDWVEYPADWNRPDGTVNRGAGYERNQHMANVSTHAVLFWDGMSRGSKHMLTACKKRFDQKQMVIAPYLYIVEPDPPPEYEVFWS